MSTVKTYLFLGDTHGNLDFVENAAHLAHQHGAEIIQTGDFGFLWPANDQIDELSDVLVDLGVTLRFVDGNHDDHPRLRRLSGSSRNGREIAPHVIYQPRGSVHEDEDGTRFLFLGGAPSIDRAFRVEGQSWWPEETITDDEHAIARSAKGPIHLLVTHDAPDYPPTFSAKGSPAYQRAQVRSMKIVDDLIRHHRPSLHAHGHWHVRYNRRHHVGTIVVGLDRDKLDLDDATLLWSREQKKTEDA